MASDYRISGGGTTIYLVNSSGQPTSAGAATAAATTPWAIRYGDWQPRAAQPNTLFAGGLPIAQSYDVVEETIPLILVGGTADTLIARLQQLRIVAASWMVSAPAVLTAQPSGMSQPVYYEIYKAHVQERAPASSEGPGEGATTAWVDLTITRSAFGGRASTETLVNGVTYTNDGASNTSSLGSPAGDVAGVEGSPLNIAITANASNGLGVAWLATVASRNKVSIATATGTMTNPASPTTVFSGTSDANNALRTTAGLKLRVGIRLSTGTNVNKIQWGLYIGTAATGTAWAQTGWLLTPYSASAQWIDLGGFSLDALRTPYNASLTLYYALAARSSDGTSCSATVDYLESLLYYDFCQVAATQLDVFSPAKLRLTQAQNLNGTAWLPSAAAQAYQATSADIPSYPATIRGRPPRARNSALLWAAWASYSGAHVKTDTVTVTAAHAPLYRTLRGNG